MTRAVTRSAAVELLRDRTAAVVPEGTAERVPLDSIAGRVAAEPVAAPADVPATDFATMDGFAFAAGDGYPLEVVDRAGPADEAPTVGPGEAVRVATGAPLPARADAVLPREDATLRDDRLAGPPIEPGTNRYPAGATARAGERLFAPGDRLAPRHAAFLRDVGIERVPVRPRPSVGILATGTEICEGVQPDRDSEALANLVRGWGGDPAILEPVPDDGTRVREAIRSAAAAHDLVLTSGGTSVGRGDHVDRALADHDRAFSAVDLRPGRPTTAAVVDGTLVCALPGKPLAAHTAAVLLVAPAFAARESEPTVRATAAVDLDLPAADLEYAIPVDLTDGRADPAGQGSSAGDLYRGTFAPGRVASSTRVARADGLALTTEPLVAGEPVAVRPYEVLE
ncbi:molybdopterin molybdotransferase MoeA [Halorubrum aethiopicum]|uniref:molybdopterin molybdotransferase MoeA n=1 Tax=Halorubrum aethiopicum TaxID=1758255 RepID=UPI00082B1357|nr:molybdopterin molybdotransferase MoeA [Halorubrum aethiopicum]